MRHPLLLLCLLLACVSYADNPAALQKQKESKAAEAKAKSILAAVEKEAQQLGDNHWAGNYYLGDGEGVNQLLSLAPAAGFSFEWYGCIGLYDRNYGSLTLKNGVITLKPELPNRQKGFSGMDTQFVPVAWGKRHYLIPVKEMQKFCAAVNEGSEPRYGKHGQFYLKRDEEKIEVSGMPDVPEAYRKYLLKEPLRARITKVIQPASQPLKKYGDIQYQIVIDKGEKEAVFKDMTLQVDNPTTHALIRITNVQKHSATATVNFVEPSGKPQVGWPLTTHSAMEEAINRLRRTDPRL